MIKKIMSGLLALFLVLGTASAFAGCKKETKATMSEKQIDQLVDEMSLKELIEQKIMITFRQWQKQGEQEESDVVSIAYNDEIKDFVSKNNFGGVILFGCNFSSGKVSSENSTSTEDAIRLINDYQQCALDSKAQTKNIPMFIAADQEGGNVYRLTEGTRMPGNMAVGATNNPQNAYTQGNIIATEMEKLGMNLDFAPNVDIISNPNNSVNSVRSFGDDAQMVSDYGLEYAKGFKDTSVLTAGKHFPGLGDSETDPHSDLSIVDKSWEELKEFELKPYKKMMEENALDMIMTAHIQVPQVNSEETWTYTDENLEEKTITRPATTSHEIMTKKLRDELGYKGLTITDALNMGAIKNMFTPQQAILCTMDAGVDIALMPIELNNASDLEEFEQIIDNIVDIVENKEENSPYKNLTKENIKESVKRILKSKNENGILNKDLYKEEDIEQKIEDAQKYVGSKQNHDIESQIASQAITLVENKETKDGYTLPFKIEENKNENILLIGTTNSVANTMEHSIENLKNNGKLPKNTTTSKITYDKNKKQLQPEDMQKIKQADYIVMTTTMDTLESLKPTQGRTKIAKEIVEEVENLEKSDKLAIVSIGMPFDLGNYSDANALLISYGAAGEDPTEAEEASSVGKNLPVAVDMIFGEISPQGTLPVEVKEIIYDKLSDNINLLNVKYNRGFGMKELKIEQLPTIETTKKHDGTNSASVLNSGEYSKATTNDDVNISAYATYDDNEIGNDKKITVKLKLTGKDAHKYYLNEKLAYQIEGAIVD